MHRDLAARNVLVFAGERLKICDFGLAKDLESAAYYRKRTKVRYLIISMNSCYIRHSIRVE